MKRIKGKYWVFGVYCSRLFSDIVRDWFLLISTNSLEKAKKKARTIAQNNDYDEVVILKFVKEVR